MSKARRWESGAKWMSSTDSFEGLNELAGLKGPVHSKVKASRTINVLSWAHIWGPPTWKQREQETILSPPDHTGSSHSQALITA